MYTFFNSLKLLCVSLWRVCVLWLFELLRSRRWFSGSQKRSEKWKLSRMSVCVWLNFSFLPWCLKADERKLPNKFSTLNITYASLALKHHSVVNNVSAMFQELSSLLSITPTPIHLTWKCLKIWNSLLRASSYRFYIFRMSEWCCWWDFTCRRNKFFIAILMPGKNCIFAVDVVPLMHFLLLRISRCENIY